MPVELTRLLVSIAIMAVITYCCRMITLVLFRKKIENRFLQSFLLYLPYGVLASMVFPAILDSTPSLTSAILGTIVALILAFFKKGLLPTALAASGTVFLAELLLKYL